MNLAVFMNTVLDKVGFILPTTDIVKIHINVEDSKDGIYMRLVNGSVDYVDENIFRIAYNYINV